MAQVYWYEKVLGFYRLPITELQELLKLNPKQAKALMRTDGFPSIKIGREYRVEEDMLRQWLNDTKEFSLDYSKC